MWAVVENLLMVKKVCQRNATIHDKIGYKHKFITWWGGAMFGLKSIILGFIHAYFVNLV